MQARIENFKSLVQEELHKFIVPFKSPFEFGATLTSIVWLPLFELLIAGLCALAVIASFLELLVHLMTCNFDAMLDDLSVLVKVFMLIPFLMLVACVQPLISLCCVLTRSVATIMDAYTGGEFQEEEVGLQQPQVDLGNNDAANAVNLEDPAEGLPVYGV